MLQSILNRSALLLILCVIGSEIATLIPSVDNFNQSWIDAHIRNDGIEGVARFMLISIVLVTAGAPRQLIAFLGGYAFGFAEGVLFSTIAVTLNCFLMVQFARLYARPIIIRMFDQKVYQVDRFLSVQPLIKSVVIRLLPIGSNLVTNLVAGVSSVAIKPFVAGSLIGYVPQMAIFALMGKGVVVHSYWKVALSLLLMAISTVLGWYLYNTYKADKFLEEKKAEEFCSANPTNK